jgi:uncharacterized protein
MLTVKTKLDKSKIAGIGLFTEEAIEKDQLVWKNNAGTELVKTPAEFAAFSDYLKNLYKHYGYMDKVDKTWKLPLDNSRFMNHSDNPNLTQAESGDYIATQKIPAGQELTCNYHQFDELIDKPI